MSRYVSELVSLYLLCASAHLLSVLTTFTLLLTHPNPNPNPNPNPTPTQRPIEHGVDLVIQSTTKFYDGHNITVGGAVICATKELHDIVSPAP